MPALAPQAADPMFPAVKPPARVACLLMGGLSGETLVGMPSGQLKALVGCYRAACE
ncbi:hypothetical protein GCM10027569_74980 [Flindersiella endophytica]